VFERDELIQVWIFHHIQIIGEAGIAARPRVPREPSGHSLASDRRHANLLIHEYFGVDLHEVWRTVEHDLPLLRLAIQKLLDAPPATQP